jgi:hypothetical protein
MMGRGKRWTVAGTKKRDGRLNVRLLPGNGLGTGSAVAESNRVIVFLLSSIPSAPVDFDRAYRGISSLLGVLCLLRPELYVILKWEHEQNVANFF